MWIFFIVRDDRSAVRGLVKPSNSQVPLRKTSGVSIKPEIKVITTYIVGFSSKRRIRYSVASLFTLLQYFLPTDHICKTVHIQSTLDK